MEVSPCGQAMRSLSLLATHRAALLGQPCADTKALAALTLRLRTQLEQAVALDEVEPTDYAAVPEVFSMVITLWRLLREQQGNSNWLAAVEQFLRIVVEKKQHSTLEQAIDWLPASLFVPQLHALQMQAPPFVRYLLALSLPHWQSGATDFATSINTLCGDAHNVVREAAWRRIRASPHTGLQLDQVKRALTDSHPPVVIEAALSTLLCPFETETSSADIDALRAESKEKLLNIWTAEPPTHPWPLIVLLCDGSADEAHQQVKLLGLSDHPPLLLAALECIGRVDYIRWLSAPEQQARLPSITDAQQIAVLLTAAVPASDLKAMASQQALAERPAPDYQRQISRKQAELCDEMPANRAYLWGYCIEPTEQNPQPMDSHHWPSLHRVQTLVNLRQQLAKAKLLSPIRNTPLWPTTSPQYFLHD